MRIQNVARLMLGLAVLTIPSGCSDPTTPDVEVLSTFRITAPAVIAAGETINVTIEAEGSQGTRPYTAFTGDVALSVSIGAVTPDVVTLVDGRASLGVVLSAAVGVVDLVATGTNATGSITIDVSGLTAIPGPPDEPVSEHVPELDFRPDLANYSKNATMAGLKTSVNTIIVSFDPDASVAEANTVLADIGAIVVGAIPTTKGVLALRLDTASQDAVAQVVSDLDADPNVLYVAADMQHDASMKTRDDGTVEGWEWERTPNGGNWGLELCRFPQMWNLNGHVVKLGHPQTIVGVMDKGFHAHEDLHYLINFRPERAREHGTHVAGIIRAGFNDNLGIDGATPFAELAVHGSEVSLMETLGALVEFSKVGARVINMSFYTSYDTPPVLSPPVEKALNSLSQVFKDTHESYPVGGEPPLLVIAAGNEGDKFADPLSAETAGPAHRAALVLNSPNMIVVEAVELDSSLLEGARRASYSNVDGQVSAPGSAVLSTIGNNGYASRDGTSMAAPHVAGLAAYLLAIDPALSNRQLVQLLTENAVPVASNDGHAGANRIDAFASVLATRPAARDG